MRARANILASCYTVNASTAALKGFHYSTTGGPSGIPEVSSGIPSPPLSPPLAAMHNAANVSPPASPRPGSICSVARRGGAAYTIAGECERLFCETLRAVFLGEGKALVRDSLAMGVHNIVFAKDRDGLSDGDSSPAIAAPAPDGFFDGRGLVAEWVEVWDYVGDARFRGFVATHARQKCLFVFFDDEVVGKDLKHGLMALLELSSPQALDCSSLNVCLDRRTELNKSLMRDLGWVGFELVTPNKWVEGGETMISDKWLFMGMEV